MRPPADPKEATAQPGDPAQLGPPPPWRDAAADVRTVVKWLIGAFAAVGAVLFAKGFVTTPALSWDTNRGQLIAAWICGFIGLIALGVLIYQAVGILRPALYELGDLPSEYVKMINGNPRYYLPQDVNSVADFTQKLEALRRAAATWQAKVEQATEALTEASNAKPTDKVAIAKAQLELAQSRVTRASLLYNLGVYNRARGQLLDRAVYWKSSRGLDVSAGTMVIVAVLAAAGGIGYQLLLATPATPKDTSATPAAPAVGELVRTDTAAGRRLWDLMGLTACQADPATARIPVVVNGGKGTAADPYVVSTLPTDRCHAATFTVVNDVAIVNTPPPVTITYTPAPSATG